MPHPAQLGIKSKSPRDELIRTRREAVQEMGWRESSEAPEQGSLCRLPEGKMPLGYFAKSR
jgi:hypothetical protein